MLLRRAHRSARRDGPEGVPWDAFQLIKACRKQGITMLGVDEGTERWCRGRRSVGVKGWLPVWERGAPPLLEMQERIRGMSLDELESLMIDFTQQQGVVPPRAEAGAARAGAGATAEAAARGAPPSTRSLTIGDIVRQAQERSGGQRSESGSVFVPSAGSSRSTG